MLFRSKKPKKKPVLASLPLFEKQEDAEAIAMLIGCEGSHPHSYGDKTLFMPCKAHPKDETDYEVDNTDNTDDVGGSNNPMDNFAGEKISIDYDDTLSTDRGFKTAQDLIKKGATLYIISARNDKEGMLKRAEELGIPSSRVFATGSNKAKVEKVKELGITQHIDNNADVIKELGDIGKKFSEMNFDDTEMSFSVFSMEEKMVVGPAMVPDKMIIRRNEITGEIYYVYRSEEHTSELQSH